MSTMQTGNTINVLISTKGKQQTLKFSSDALVRSSGGAYFKYYMAYGNGKEANSLKLSPKDYDALLNLDADKNGVINKKDYDLLKKQKSEYVYLESCEGNYHLTVPIGEPDPKTKRQESFDVLF